MRLVEDPETVAWFEKLAGQSDDFEWDEGNRTKNRKHDVDPDDVEAMFEGPMVFAGRIVEPAHQEARWLSLGKDRSARNLALIFARRGQRLRPISCRPMRRKERKLYEQALEETEG